jgi:hypothetical protein
MLSLDSKQNVSDCHKPFEKLSTQAPMPFIRVEEPVFFAARPEPRHQVPRGQGDVSARWLESINLCFTEHYALSRALRSSPVSVALTTDHN